MENESHNNESHNNETHNVITQCLYDGKNWYYIAVDDKEGLYKKIGELLDGTTGEDKGNNWRG